MEKALIAIEYSPPCTHIINLEWLMLGMNCDWTVFMLCLQMLLGAASFEENRLSGIYTSDQIEWAIVLMNKKIKL